MFSRILIANRGEIAVRIIRSAHRLGVSTVAVHSEADAEALHVALADRAVAIGPAPPSESYLNGERIIAAALDTGAEAIHPGYGFLSENPDFVEAVATAGLIFIGPSSAAIRAMGLKDAAKSLMTEAGVPVVPGYHGVEQDEGLLADEADRTGYPVLIKAVAGGGGKGMRLVWNRRDFSAALASARGEARSAFGNDAVLVEKYVSAPRHIEIQVFGDGFGNAVHLFERDCSLQRRHQKVIEEAPAPGMTAAMRKAMGAAAVQAAKAIGYCGAGTVEFIVDGSEGLNPDRFWFMEMNTRLQVEHPVTEAITGIDLVEWQLRVAAGEPLPRRQDELAISGHAFEARLYAEDPARGFLPAIGTLTHLEFPADVRVDSGVRAGDAISPWYDPMIAKLVVHGPTRATALGALARALEASRVAGSVTNLGFLARLARQEDFVAALIDTGLIDRNLEALVTPAPLDDGLLAVAAIAAEGLEQRTDRLTGFALWAPLRRRVVLEVSDGRHEVALDVRGPGRFVAAGRDVEIDGCAGGEMICRIDGKPRRLGIARSSGALTLFEGAQAHVFLVPDPLARTGDAHAGGDEIRAPMPGLVRHVAVESGAAVAAGDILVILEAMKMEHALTAPRDGTVAEILVATGDQVTDGNVMIRLELQDE